MISAVIRNILCLQSRSVLCNDQATITKTLDTESTLDVVCTATNHFNSKSAAQKSSYFSIIYLLVGYTETDMLYNLAMNIKVSITACMNLIR